MSSGVLTTQQLRLRMRSTGNRRTALETIVAVALVVYVVTLVAVLHRVLPAIYSLADGDLPPYLTLMWSHAAPGSRMLMANFSWYGPFWLMNLTRWIPDYRWVWEMEPWLCSVLGIALVGWTSWRIAGRTAGLIVLAGLIAAGTFVMQLQFVWIHTVAYVNTCVLGAFAVWLTDHGTRTRRSRLWLAAALVGGFTAVGVASDKLVLVAGLAPFAIACLVAIIRLDRHLRPRLLLAAGISIAVPLIGSVIIGHIMRSAGLASSPFPITLAPMSEIPGHMLLLVKAVVVLFNGWSGGGGLLPGELSYYLCTVAVVIVTANAAVEVVSLSRRVAAVVATGFRRRLAIGAGVEVHASSSAGGNNWSAARSVSSTYWLMSICALGSTFVVTTIPIDIESKRYVVTIVYALVVLGATRAGAARSFVVTGSMVAAVCMVAAVSISLLLNGSVLASYSAFPTPRLATELSAYARRAHASVVYASYLDAFPLGWFGSGDPPVYPVEPCGAILCREVSDTAGFGIDTWYRHNQGRSLFISNGTTPPAAYGKARLIGTLGGRGVYLYNYDIASKLGPLPLS